MGKGTTLPMKDLVREESDNARYRLRKIEKLAQDHKKEETALVGILMDRIRITR